MDGKPVAGAQIEIKPSPGEWPNARAHPPRVTRSAKDGSYAFKDLPAIDWSVEVTSPDAQRGIRELRFREADGDSRSPGEASFELERGFSLRGTVLDAAGKPASGARISLGYLEVVADGRGKFELHHLSPRWNLQLRAYRADGSVVIEDVGKDLSKAGTTTPPEVVLRLRAPSDPRVLRLKIVDVNGKPMPNLWLTIGTNSMGKTDARGMFFTDTGSETTASPSLNPGEGLSFSEAIKAPASRRGHADREAFAGVGVRAASALTSHRVSLFTERPRSTHPRNPETVGLSCRTIVLETVARTLSRRRPDAARCAGCRCWPASTAARFTPSRATCGVRTIRGCRR